uniref:Uncharacterized protein n=1 Tax=Phenylobacterium glaciei TaxID=2803784 RepID=A0A974P4K4_9CAUL|nr:hypothetical protein JKL49_08055 [Phenylobacterium glaciei]
MTAVADFEALRRRILRRKRLETLAGLLIFSVLLLVSFQRSQFFSSDIGGDPLGRIGDFLTRMVPDLKGDVLLESRTTTGSLYWWFYDLPVWLKLGWQTVEMAIIATVVGAVGDCWPPSSARGT